MCIARDLFTLDADENSVGSVKYGGMVSGFSSYRRGGAGALLTGLGPTAVGYFIQGWFKFGVEYFSQRRAKHDGTEAWDNRNTIYLGSAAVANSSRRLSLPARATRIRLVSNPTYAPSTISAMGKMASEGHHQGFYSVSVQSWPSKCRTPWPNSPSRRAAEAIHDSMGKRPRSARALKTSPSRSPPVSSPVSSPPSSLTPPTRSCPVNKAGAGGGVPHGASRSHRPPGRRQALHAGLAARCVMIGTLTAGQFGIFDSVMEALDASKFHFHNPSAGH